jgi:hypothetical protein
MSHHVGDRVWVPHNDHAWLCGKITRSDGGDVEVGTTEVGKIIIKRQQASSLEPCGSHIDDQVENLVDLDELSEVILYLCYYM